MAGIFKSKKISIIGSGNIGRSFALLFASSGYQVFLYDADPKQVADALTDLKQQLTDLETSGTLRGKLTAQQQFQCIKASESLKDCLENSIHVQECVSDNLQLKIKVFKDMDDLVGPNTVLSSSSSSFMPSELSTDLVNKANCLVSHPYTPLYYVPAIEVVPAPWTSEDAMQKTCSLLKDVGLKPIRLKREVPGFAMNRMQISMFNECCNLVKDKFLSVEDVDNIVSHGLAMRYVWCGPFETIHLNAEGTDSYMERYGETIHTISQTLKTSPSWSMEERQAICEEMEKLVPLDQLEKRREWRDERIMELVKLKRQVKEKQE